MNIVNKIISKIVEYDPVLADSAALDGIMFRVANQIGGNETLEFLIFTCSTIQSEYLFNATPWLYVNLDSAGNNLEDDLPKLNKFFAELKSIHNNVSLTVVIGNTDPYYIYLEQFKNFPSRKKEILSRFVERWQLYRADLEKWLDLKLDKVNYRVVSWYEFEIGILKKENRSFEIEFNKVYQEIETLFDPTLFDWELQALKQQFGPGKYFEKLTKPADGLLREWIKRKFAEYALQGLWLYEYYPQALLIQNEKPTALRSQMYQPLVRRRYADLLPIIECLGQDSSGYQ